MPPARSPIPIGGLGWSAGDGGGPSRGSAPAPPGKGISVILSSRESERLCASG